MDSFGGVDIWSEIFSRLDSLPIKDYVALSQSCRTFWKALRRGGAKLVRWSAKKEWRLMRDVYFSQHITSFRVAFGTLYEQLRYYRPDIKDVLVELPEEENVWNNWDKTFVGIQHLSILTGKKTYTVELKGDLPVGLISLCITREDCMHSGEKFILSSVLPESLKVLRINTTLVDRYLVLPSELEVFQYCGRGANFGPIKDSIPEKLQTLIIAGHFFSTPPYLKEKTLPCLKNLQLVTTQDSFLDLNVSKYPNLESVRSNCIANFSHLDKDYEFVKMDKIKEMNGTTGLHMYVTFRDKKEERTGKRIKVQ